MDRNCKTCKQNKEQAELSCGYLPKEQRNPDKFYDFELYKRPDFGVSICPVWYYLQYLYIYRVYKLLKESAVDLFKVDWHKRFIFETASNYFGLELEAKIKEMKERGKK